MTRAGVAVVCDLRTDTGVGHALRCAALAEELVRRDLRVVFVVDPEAVPWVTRRITGTGAEVANLPHDASLPGVLVEEGFAGVVFDSYLLAPEVYAGARDAGLVTLAFVDGDLRGASADVLLDQNIGAEEGATDAVGAFLRGLEYAVLRDEVIALRPSVPPVREHDRPRVLAFLGGTDPFEAAPALLRAVTESALPCDVRVVGATPVLVAELEAITPAAGQHIDVIGPTDRLPEFMAQADVVLCAGGSSVWEVAALGRAAGVLCLADNQRTATERLVAGGVVADLGSLDDLRSGGGAALAGVRRLLGDPGYADSLARAAWLLLDGRGKARVVDTFLARLADAGAVAP